MGDTSAGRKLSAARLARGLSIDAAAHATKMRPDKILALENDDHSRFGGSAYAKSFLQMYSRFLGVDVSEQLRDLEPTNSRVEIEGYQYLNHEPEPAPVERLPSFRRRSGPPSIWPLVALVVVGFGAWTWFSIHDYWRRLGLDGSATVAVAKPLVMEVPAEVKTAEIDKEPVPPGEKTPGTEPGAAAEPASATSEEPAKGAPVNELSVEPLRTTYVTIREKADADPKWQGYLYKNGGLLRFSGTTFFVEVKDETAVQIRKNGHPVAYQAPGVSVQ